MSCRLSRRNVGRSPTTTPILDALDVRATEDFSYTSDGQRIDGLLLKPAGFKARRPAIPRSFACMEVPRTSSRTSSCSNGSCLRRAGMPSSRINPRGSTGRGFEFARAVHGNTGDRDVKDVLAGVDYLVQQGVIDPERLGIGGRSYGDPHQLCDRQHPGSRRR